MTKNTLLTMLTCAAALVGCTPQETETAPEPEPVSTTTTTAAPTSPSTPTVTLSTTMGDIVIELDPDNAPITVENFIAYAQDGHYDGTIFHRVIPNFMIQGGGFTPEMQQQPTRAPIKNEAANGLKNLRGAIAMARTNVPDSATSQFFINHRDNPPLDYAGPGREGYAVFGRVVEGMEVVDAIAAVATTQHGPHGNVPTTPVVIESAIVH